MRINPKTKQPLRYFFRILYLIQQNTVTTFSYIYQKVASTHNLNVLI